MQISRNESACASSSIEWSRTDPARRRQSASVVSDVVDADNIRMVQRARGARFALESGDPLTVLGEARRCRDFRSLEILVVLYQAKLRIRKAGAAGYRRLKIVRIDKTQPWRAGCFKLSGASYTYLDRL